VENTCLRTSIHNTSLVDHLRDKNRIGTHVVAFNVEPIVRLFGTVSTVTRRRVRFLVVWVLTTSTGKLGLSNWDRRCRTCHVAFEAVHIV